MLRPISRTIEVSRRKPLAACFTAVFALGAPAAIASTLTVTNCNDTGGGSLRGEVALAGETDTVDLSGLTTGSPGCSGSTVTVLTGAITVNQNNLTVLGPSSGITLTAKYGFLQVKQSRIFDHEGTGTLRLENLDITYGSPYSSATNVFGGCIYSKGSVYLYKSAVSSCIANAKNHGAVGGGVFSAGDLTVKYGTISGNTAGVSSSIAAYAGGARVYGSFTAKYSTISGNVAAPSVGSSVGGGVLVGKSVTIAASTISGNSAKEVGGLAFEGIPAGNSAVINNSTISGNAATAGVVGGIYASIPVTLQNSTIAFNTATIGSFTIGHYDAPGLALSSSGGPFTTNLQSSLISNNTYGSTENDFSTDNVGGNTVTVSGANNLIRATFNSVPTGTITLQCPLLGSLRDNGGMTRTHALLSHSPAIDAGNDNATKPFLGGPYPYDQRSTSPFARVDNGQPDIGAYEVQQGDIVFNANFEGCPILF